MVWSAIYFVNLVSLIFVNICDILFILYRFCILLYSTYSTLFITTHLFSCPISYPLRVSVQCCRWWRVFLRRRTAGSACFPSSTRNTCTSAAWGCNTGRVSAIIKNNDTYFFTNHYYHYNYLVISLPTYF